MKITIITLVSDDTADVFVAAVKGELTDEQKSEVADRLMSSNSDLPDDVGFAVVEVHDSIDDVHDFALSL